MHGIQSAATWTVGGFSITWTRLVRGRQINWDFVEQHKESILKSLSSTTRHDVLPKFGWACRYHNVFCHWHRDEPGYLDRYRIAAPTNTRR